MKREIVVGDFRCRMLDGGTFLIDGGAMFGMVPRSLWEKKVRLIEGNSVSLSMNPLLVQGRGHTILIDPGFGPREAKRFRKTYCIRDADPLFDQLRRAGADPETVDIVINTHLHWDHSGANLISLSGRRPAPAFPKAAYLVQQGEWEAALRPNEITREGYLLQAVPTLLRSRQLELLHGETEIVPGIRVIKTPGHTAAHQSVLIESGGKTLAYLGDILPTRAHLPLSYISALDLEPVRTLETKRTLMEEGRAKEWTLAFCHEPGNSVFLALKRKQR
jgi:glyoxylase-like metal-dependent hydrolase (beta-lactamase superfamily II)